MAGISRFLGGYPIQFDNTGGLELGRNVARETRKFYKKHSGETSGKSIFFNSPSMKRSAQKKFRKIIGVVFIYFVLYVIRRGMNSNIPNLLSIDYEIPRLRYIQFYYG